MIDGLAWTRIGFFLPLSYKTCHVIPADVFSPLETCLCHSQRTRKLFLLRCHRQRHHEAVFRGEFLEISPERLRAVVRVTVRLKAIELGIRRTADVVQVIYERYVLSRTPDS